ncbi:MAG TPA: aminopeptidase N C-terminal domain-containing protein, partial [Rhabdaerophilum sp.]|nr:aminopeptidase N C-terminal domain-containing protein [Rhabdaerophilum sp.]
IAKDVDPGAIGIAVDHLRDEIARFARRDIEDAYTAFSRETTFSPNGASAGRRALRSQLLRYLVAADRKAGAKTAFRQFESAHNMTDRIGALAALLP